LCALLKRTCILINARETPDAILAADPVVKFIEENAIETLNCSGRKSRIANGDEAGF
jgi:hypothetical protein